MEKIEKIIKRLKADNTKNFNLAIKEGTMESWDRTQVKNLVEKYLDSVLILYKEEK